MENMIISSRTARQYTPIVTNPSALALASLSYVSLFCRIHAVFPHSYDLRAFDSYLLLYTTRGQGRITYQDTSLTLPLGSVLFFHCDVNHRIELYEAKEWDYIYFYINGAGVSSYYKTFLSILSSPLCMLSPISSISMFTERLAQCIEHTDKHNLVNRHQDFIIHDLLVSLLTSLLSEQECMANTSVRIPLYLSKVKECFDDDYANDFSLDTLSSKYHISKYKLVRDFTNYLGTSPISYLIAVRISHAKKLLADTNDPINEIAARVGIDNMNHFIYLFKKQVGMTPGAYRKECEKEPPAASLLCAHNRGHHEGVYSKMNIKL